VSTVGSVLINFGAATAGYFAGSKAVKDDAGSIGSAFGGLGGKVGGAFLAAGAAVAAAGIGMVAALKSGAEEVTRLAHEANRLSVTTEAFSRLGFAAKQTGVDAETLSKAMMKSQEEIGKAATEGGEAAAKLQKMGFNVSELINQNPADQFRSIAQTISEIQNPAARAAAEVAIFGKSGAELKPLLEQGAAGLDRMGAEADKLGITLSSVDAENTLRAGQAVQKVQDAVSGLAQHIAAGLSPYVEDVANRIIAWAEEGNRMQKILGGAMQVVAYAAAGVATVIKIGKAEIELFGSGGAWAIFGLIEAFNALAKAGAWVSEHVFGHKIDTSGIDAAADHMKAKAKELFAASMKDADEAFSGRTAAKAFEWFDSVKSKANATSQEAIKARESMKTAFTPPANSDENLKKIATIIADLHKEIDTFGQSEGLKKLYELKQAGATDAQLAEADALAKQLDILKQQAEVVKTLDQLRKDARQAGMDQGGKLVDDLQQKGATAGQIEEAKRLQKAIEDTNAAKEEAKKLDEAAKKAKEDALTPLQKEQQALQDLKKLYDTGRITAQEFASAAAKKESELHGEKHDTQGAVTRGSQEAFKLMNEINHRGHDKKEQLAQAQLNAQLKANQIIADLDKKLAPKPATKMKMTVA
jgi:hypothetical protein